MCAFATGSTICLIYIYALQGEVGLDALGDAATSVIVQENQSNKVPYDMIWYDMIWYDWFDMIGYDMIW